MRANETTHTTHHFRHVLSLCVLFVVWAGHAWADTGTISGFVTDVATGAGIEGVTVVAYDANGVFQQSTTTDAGTGAYTIEGLSPGTHYVRTIANPGVNYIDEAYNNILCLACAITSTTPLTVVTGSTTSDINFALARGSQIRGTVSDATSGLGIDGVTVRIYSGLGVAQKTVVSDVDGAYLAAGLPPGTYYARTVVPATSLYIDEAYNNVPCVPCAIATTTAIATSGTATTAHIDFSLAVGGGVSGTVTDAATGAGISHTVVSVINAAGHVAESVSPDTNGHYSIVGLVPGTYYARTTTPSLNYIDEAYDNIPCLNCTITATTPIAVTASGVAASIDFTLSMGGSIAGSVTRAGTSVAIPNVIVTAHDASNAPLKAATADASGLYVINGLPAGRYYVIASPPPTLNVVAEAYHDVPCVPCPALASLTAVSVTSGAMTTNVDFGLTSGGSITGTVTTPQSGAPQGGVSISIYSAGGVFLRTATSEATGTYTVIGLPTGSYFARTGLSGQHATELYRNADCPHLACSVTSGTPISVTAGAATRNIDFSPAALGPSDVVVDFGAAYGVWLLPSNGSWIPLHALSPVAMVRGDLDGNGQDDLVVNFGTGVGVYAWMNHARWAPIHLASPSLMVTGDLDGNGRDDIVMVFPGRGTWRWSDGVWTPLHALDVRRLAVGNLDGTGGKDLILDFAGYGLFTYTNNATWTHLHPLSVNLVVVADLDGNGRESILADFPGYGLWVFRAGVWSPLNLASPRYVVAGHLNANGRTDLVIDFGATYGTWIYLDNQAWVPLHPFSTQGIVLADRDATAVDEVIIDFGPNVGLWQFGNGSTWAPLHSTSPEDLHAGRLH